MQRLALCLLALAPPLAAAQSADQPRVVEGRVILPTTDADTAAGEVGRPVPGQWVVLHRVGSDRAGAIDSVQSDRRGAFRFRYMPTGSADALYFVSTRYAGIAYFSPPLRSAIVRGADADVFVHDTTSSRESLRMEGRHFVLSSPRGTLEGSPGPRREVAEVFEFANQDTRTVVARDSTTPVWSIVLPQRAESLSVAPGDITAAAVMFRDGRAELYAPISPGVRQLVITYVLPDAAMPLAMPIGNTVGVLEVLLEEPRARASGAGLAEVAPATIEGRQFRRLLAQNVAANAVVRIETPVAPRQHRRALIVLATVTGLGLLGGLAFWNARRKPARRRSERGAVSQDQRGADELIAELATLDSRFERMPAAERDAKREEYDRERAALKQRIERLLAARRAPS